jgi:citrate lyase alpha subunit
MKELASRGASRPRINTLDNRIVAVVEYRDGTVIDTVRAAA